MLKMTAKKINELPTAVVRQLCRYLNTHGSGVKNWKDLVAHAPGNVYDAIYDVHAFARAGQRMDSSPAEEVLTDFASLGINVDELYKILFEMEAVSCMELLTVHVSLEVLVVVEEAKQERMRARRVARQPITSHENISYPDGEGESPPDIHPEFGPLPHHPPPTATSQPQISHALTQMSHDQFIKRISNCGSISHGGNSPPHVLSTRLEPTNEQGHHLPPRMRPRPPGLFYTPTPSHSSAPPTQSPSWPSNGYQSSTSPNGYSSSDWSSDSTFLPPLATPTQSDTTVEPSRHTSSSENPAPPPARGCPSPNILHFLYAELSNVTEDFTEDIIGIGAFGTVFRAKIRGNGPFAIKKLHNESEMGGSMFYDTIHRETFSQELQLLTRYNHRNILSLVAYSNDGPMPCLVYEYMENGSLAECLVGKRNVVLPWQLRLDIAKQIANALHFLHTVNHPTCLVHGDVKSANILLDAHLIPKLSDFGLARELKRKPNERSTYSTKSDVVMGTMAYMAPEFLRNKKFTPRTDVYSYGVVLLEMFTGQPALSCDVNQKTRVLTDRLARLIADSDSHREEILQVADPRAGWPQQNALELFDIATVCLVHIPKKRPGMDQVLTQLGVIVPSV